MLAESNEVAGMCELSSEKTSSSSEINNVRGPFTICQVEVEKSALNLAVSTEESSTSRESSSIGEIQLQICQEIDVLDSGKAQGDGSAEREPWSSTDGSSQQAKCSDRSTEEAATLEYTLAIIKPEAMMFKKEIERLMIEEDFKICQTRWLHLTPEQVSDFYCDKYEQQSFAQLVCCMSSAPILVYVISKRNAIEDWKTLIGPENIAEAKIFAPDSIRGKYGRVEHETKKLIHGSADKSSAEKEIKFFFPDRKIETMPTEEAALQYLWNEINEPLTEALIKCCEEKPKDPIAWLGNWLLDYKSNTPKYLCAHDLR